MGDPQDDVLLELLDRWEERRREGRPAAAIELAGGDAALAERLTRLIERRERAGGRPRSHTEVDPAETRTVSDVWDELTAIGLVGGAARDAFATTGGRSPESVHELLERLRASAALTPWQAEQVAAGRGESLSLGNYLLLRPLGKGGMGEVFLARHRVMDRVVAVKRLAPGGDPAGGQALERFEREVRTLARLHHPNIVAAYDAGVAGGSLYLVMEYVEGEDLSAYVKARGPLPPEEACDLVRQAALGLGAAHAAGFVHRDVKPGNLLRGAHGVVKVLDLGLASWQGRADGGPSELTSTEQVMGTVDYLAPEQARNTKAADARSDVYALGCTLHYLLTAGPPYRGASLMERLLAHREAPVPELPAGDAVAPPLRALHAAMLAKDPADRPPTMADVARRLADLTAPAPIAVARPPVPVPLAPVRRPKRTLLNALVGLLAVCVVSLALWAGLWLGPSETSRPPADAPPPRTTASTVPEAAPLPAQAGSTVPAPPADAAVTPVTAAAPSLASSHFADMDGRTAYLETTVLDDTGGPLTVECWVWFEYTAGHGSHPCLIESDSLGLRLGGFHPLLYHRRKAAEGPETFELRSPEPFPPGRFVHLAAIWSDEGECRIYVDGKSVAKAERTGGRPAGRQPLRFGGSLADFHIWGGLDEIRVSDVARYRDESFVPARRFEPDERTVALYHFDEPDGEFVADASPHGRHARLVGGKRRREDLAPSLFVPARFEDVVIERPSPGDAVSGIAWIDGQEVVAGGRGALYFWKPATDECRSVPAGEHDVRDVVAGAAGHVVISTWGGRVLAVDGAPESAKRIAWEYAADESDVTSICLSPDLNRVLATVRGRSARKNRLVVLDTGDGTVTQEFVSSGGDLGVGDFRSGVFMPDGTLVTVRVTDVGDNVQRTLAVEERDPTSFDVVKTVRLTGYHIGGEQIFASREGRWLVLAHWGHQATLIDRETGAAVADGSLPNNVWTAQVDELQMFVATDREVHAFDHAGRRLRSLWQGDHFLALSPDGKWLANAGASGLKIWSTADLTGPPVEFPPLPKGPFALATDGVKSYGTLPLDPRNLADYTVEAWVRPADAADAPSRERAFLATAHSSGLGLAVETGAQERVWRYRNKPADDRPRSDIAQRRPRAAADGWHHVAVCVSGDSRQLFIDGVARGEPAARERREHPFRPLIVGAGFDPAAGTADHFAGEIDEIRVSKVARYREDFRPARRFEPDPDTLGLYHGDEGAGDILADSSGLNRHGRLHGVTWRPTPDGPGPAAPPPITLVPPPTAQYADLDGATTNLVTPIIDDGKSPLTVEFWLWHLPTLHSPYSPALLTGDSIAIAHRNNVPYIGSKTSEGGAHKWRDAVAAASLASHRFAHVAGVFDEGEDRLYVDGRLVARQSRAAPRTPSPGGLRLGGRPDDPGSLPAGGLDEVRISRVARYLGESFTPARRFEPDDDTLALYHLDEPSGLTALDSSPHGKHGRLSVGRRRAETQTPSLLAGPPRFERFLYERFTVNDITAVAWSPDGRRIAAAGYHRLYVWNPRTDELRVLVQPSAFFYSVRWLGETRLVAGDDDGRVVCFDGRPAAPDVPLWETRIEGRHIDDLSVDPRQAVVAVVAHERRDQPSRGVSKVVLLDAADGSVRYELGGDGGTVQAATFLPDGTLVTLTMLDERGPEDRHRMRLEERDPGTYAVKKTLELEARGDRDGLALTTSPDGRWLAIRNYGHNGLLVDRNDGHVVGGDVHDNVLRSNAVDGDLFVSTRSGGHLFHGSGGRRYRVLPTSYTMGSDVSPDGRWLAVGSGLRICVWSVESLRGIQPDAPLPRGDHALGLDAARKSWAAFDVGPEFDRFTLEAWFRRPAAEKAGQRNNLFAPPYSSGPWLSVRPGRGADVWQFDDLPADSGNGHVTIKRDGPSASAGWHHVAAVRGEKDWRIFVDGKPLGEAVPHGKAEPVRRALLLGAADANASEEQFFTGEIDEIRVSDVARYEGDFTPARRFEPDAHTRALFHCDEGEGEVLADASGNGRHARLYRVEWRGREE